MAIMRETFDISHKQGGYTPAKPCKLLAFSALIVSVLTLVAIGAQGNMMIANSASDSLGNTLGWILSTAGLVAAAVVLWYGVKATQAAVGCSIKTRAGDVLGARANSDLARQDALISLSLVIALALVVTLILSVAINDASIQKTFLRWSLMQESFIDILKAFWLNIWIAVLSQVLVMIFGLILAIARMLPGRAGKPIKTLAIAYIDIMRAVPAIIIIYLIGFGLPLTNLPFISQLSPVWFAVIALTLTYSAYTAEMYRSGIESIHPSQWSATRSLGFSYISTLRYVILPQAIRRVVPPMLGSFIALQKDTSLVNIIGTMDAFNQAKFYSSANFNLSSVTVVALLFIVITIPQTRFVDYMLSRGSR
ncbi:TPA: amino acid ABC transporter permease [Klebsiella pneumoniae]|nr:amino acid ABC transporter permease [Klebsiella pneumoniae]